MITNQKFTEMYEKLKYFAFYDKTLVHLKEQLIDFESKGFNKKINSLSKNFNAKNEEYFKKLIKNIELHITPKNIECDEENTDFVSSLAGNEKIKISSLSYYIKAPIELHILNILWINFSLAKLPNTQEKHAYANKLELDFEGNPKKGKKIFKPYFQNYKAWLNNSLIACESTAKKNKKFVLISLDIKRFYYSIRLSISKLTEEIQSEYEFKNFLTKINIDIHKEWDLQLNLNKDTSTISLPIGLLSSGLLANYYCKNIDENILSSPNTRFYGRYVDDILIIKEIDKKLKYQKSEKIIQDQLVSQGIVGINNLNKNYFFIGSENLEIQEGKLKIFLFSGKNSLKHIEALKKELIKNSSEVNLTPDINLIYNNMDKVPFEIKTNDKRFKIRDIQSIANDKFEVSKLLSQTIYIQKYCNLHSEAKEKLFKNLDNIFRGKYILEFRNLWLKYLVCLIIFERKKELINFINRTEHILIRAIFENGKDKDSVIKNLKLELRISLCLALSGNFVFFKKVKESLPFKNNINFNKPLSFTFLDSISEDELLNYRKSHLLDPTYFRVEGLFLFNEYFDKSNNLYSYDVAGQKQLKLRKDKKWYIFFPRYIKFWEIQNALYLNSLFNDNKKNIISPKLNSLSLDLYWKYNFERYFEFSFLTNVLRNQHKNTKPELFGDCEINYIEDKYSENYKHTFHIAIPSYKVTEKQVELSLKPGYKIYLHSFLQFSRLLNELRSRKIDFVTFPELSIPHQFLGALVNFSREQQVTICAGLEYIVVNNYAYNISVTIIPSKNNNFKFANVFFRIKNHYSPEEIRIIQNLTLNVPIVGMPIYYLFNWNSITFTLFNCFELSNISHRSLFKGRVDLICGILLNRDRFYYDSIAQSTVRDLHCYLLNVNSSKYKGTFLLQPTKNDRMYIAELKGGIEPYFLIETINVKDLREFQLDYLSGKRINNPEYKPLPPDYIFDTNRIT